MSPDHLAVFLAGVLVGMLLAVLIGTLIHNHSKGRTP